jgi:hypothetical protein
MLDCVNRLAAHVGACRKWQESDKLLTPHTGYEYAQREAAAGIYPPLADGKYLYVVLSHDPSQESGIASKRRTGARRDLHPAA